MSVCGRGPKNDVLGSSTKWQNAFCRPENTFYRPDRTRSTKKEGCHLGEGSPPRFMLKVKSSVSLAFPLSKCHFDAFLQVPARGKLPMKSVFHIVKCTPQCLSLQRRMRPQDRSASSCERSWLRPAPTGPDGVWPVFVDFEWRTARGTDDKRLPCSMALLGQRLR